MMASDNEDTISDSEKVRIASDFILHSPPGEFREVLNDVRHLLDNDALLKENASGVFAQYSKDQLTPVSLEPTESTTLITEFNDLGGSRFSDPTNKQSFKYDYIREEASDFSAWTPDEKSEPWRLALEQVWTKYAKDHYTNAVGSVFSSSNNTGTITLTACIEGHQFQPSNFWNGRWRSIWSTTFNPSTPGEVDLNGILKVQVHYYEDGNVQLVSSKDIKESFKVADEVTTATNLRDVVKAAENEYQIAISENYTTMSDTTFKALRRPLPVTRSKIEWNKIMGYRIGSELKPN